MDAQVYREYVGQLGRAYGFTFDELRANQAGTLHPAQLARGQRKGWVGVVVLAVLGVLALAGGLGGAWFYLDDLYFEPTQSDYNAMGAIAGVGVLLALAFFFGAARSRARQRVRKAAFLRSQLDVVEAPVNLVHVGGNAQQFFIKVGGRSIATSEKVFELMTQGATYRFHFVDDQLLTFAPSLEDPMERAEYERELAQFARSLAIAPSRLV